MAIVHARFRRGRVNRRQAVRGRVTFRGQIEWKKERIQHAIERAHMEALALALVGPGPVEPDETTH